MIKKLINAVFKAAGKDEVRSFICNKIAVYKQGDFYAFAATDGHRLHFAYEVYTYSVWSDNDQVAVLDAKKSARHDKAFTY